MTTTFFKVQLSVRPIGGGEAELVVPKALEGLNYQFVLVKDGAEEGIIQLEATTTQLKAIEKDKHCKKLSSHELEALKNSYPPPKLKQQYHPLSEDSAAEETTESRTVETIQTVRSGFYLIDVPILT